LFGNVKELPKPIGNYRVGVKRYDFIDQSRKQVFSFEDKNAVRKIPIILYYPSDSKENKTTEPYISIEEAKVLNKKYFRLTPKNLYKVKTHLYKDISISKKEEKYPVIIYSHGLGAYMQNNTILLSNLASLGYIVVSIGHPYEAGVLKYLNGSIVKLHTENRKLYIGTKEENKKIKELIKRTANSDEDYLEIEKEYNKLIAPELHSHVKIWEEDSRFILDKLYELDNGEIESIFKGKFNLENGAAIMGHSFGGSTAGQTCWKDKRFSCGINIDCDNYGEYAFKDINKPFMLIGQSLRERFAKSVFLNNSCDSYMMLIAKTAHLGYTDALFTSRLLNLFNLLGKRDKYEFNKIITTYIVNFLDKYHKNKKDIKLKNITFNGVKFLRK